MSEKLENEKSLPEVYYARHMKQGVANYPENKEIIYISNETIADMAKTFVGKPVFVHHQNIDLDNLKEQMDGVVSDSFWNKYDGEWWVKFIAITDKCKQAIKNGWKVSNCYNNLVRGNGGTCIDVKYDSEIIGGVFNHLAIVENPRYENAEIYTEEEYNEYNNMKKQKLDKISNSKGETMKNKIMNEIDVKDLLLSKDSEITVGEAIEMYKNSKKVIDESAEILLSNGEKVLVSELINACKKNEDDEEKKENEDEEPKKENEDKRKEIDEVAGIMKSAGADDEAIKTAIKKMEKIAYEPSETDKKDNEEPKDEDKKDNEDEDKKEDKEENKKNSSTLRNAYKTAFLNNSKSFYEEQADAVCNQIFNGIERAKELGI